MTWEGLIEGGDILGIKEGDREIINWKGINEDQPTCRTKRISCAILIRKSTSIASNKLQYTN